MYDYPVALSLLRYFKFLLKPWLRTGKVKLITQITFAAPATLLLTLSRST